MRDCHAAYERIFQRVGLSQVVSVASDSGMMGGSIAHEFMLLTPVGEDSIVICEACGYKSNMEAAESIAENTAVCHEVLTEVSTPAVHSIEQLCDFFQIIPEKTCKAVAYSMEETGETVILFLRGDMEANEAKLRRLVGSEIRPADLTQTDGLYAGFIGPVGLRAECRVLFDGSLKNASGLVCGGNKPDVHLKGLNVARDLGDIEFVDAAKTVDGGICPCCGRHSLSISRGIEVGNIFQLGTKYTRSMDMTYLDEAGEKEYPLMGCYGIGIGRLAACICEAHHDAYGPVWPMTVAPWQVHLCAVRSDAPDVRATADALYLELKNQGIDVIYDDRAVSTGVMFADADLIGVPLRIIVSPRNLKECCCEITARDKSFQTKVALEECVSVVCDKITEQLKMR